MQEEYKRVCGKCYNREFLDYVCVDEMGNIIRPNYLTTSFQVLLEKNGMRKIRFHDLRHTCASLLLKNGVPMKQIQEWLGHSDFSTTANIYAHLDYNSKLNSADAMISGMSGALNFVSWFEGKKRACNPKIAGSVAEGVRFELTWHCCQMVFKTTSLWPLR